MLEIVARAPGVTVGEVCDHFEISRFAVMNHLNVLEDAGLIRRETDGRQRRVFRTEADAASLLARWWSTLGQDRRS